MGKQFHEMGAQELLDLLKSMNLSEAAQVELIKGFSVTRQGSLGAVDEGDGGTNSVQRREGKGTLPDRPRKGDVDGTGPGAHPSGEEMMRGLEGGDDDEEEDIPPRKRRDDEDEDEDDGDEEEGDAMPFQRKSKKSYAKSLADHEDEYVAQIFKGRNAEQLAELVDSTPYLERHADAHAAVYGRVAKSLGSLTEVIEIATDAIARQTKIAKSLGAEVATLKSDIAALKGDLAKSRAADSAAAAVASEEALTKAEESRPLATGAFAIINNGTAKSHGASHLVTGNADRDLVAIQEVLEKAANKGEPRALKMMIALNSTPYREIDKLVSQIPTEWIA